MRIFVAGGTGVLGRPLVEALVDRGHEVTASTHRTENFSVIEALGARPALMDGFDDAAVRQAILETEPEVVINQITALSAPSRDYARWLAVTNRLRSEGTKTLMTAAHGAGTRRVVAQSASFMTQPVGSDPTDESSPLYLEAPASTTSWATSPPPRLSGCRTWPTSWTPLRRGASPRRRPSNRSARKPCTRAPSSTRPATPRPSLSWG
jgi:nucleoside-diphosphate-sugar epimerase